VLKADYAAFQAARSLTRGARRSNNRASVYSLVKNFTSFVA
jgi:hypothetical protein